MTAFAALLTPFDRGTAIELGNKLWRKRVLPIGDIQYQGRTLHFTPGYLAGLAEAFRSRAYDQVSFQLADAGNSHTNDPERHRGTIVDMQTEPDGLYITLDPTPAGEQVLRENPYLGVSARIVEQYQRADGKFYPAAVQHVLGTLDPRIPGLGAWQTIEAANTPSLVIDLTGSSYAGQEVETMPEQMNPQQQANLSKLLNMDPAALDRLLGQQQAPPAGNGSTPPAPPADDELTDAELADLIAALDDDELAAVEAGLDADTADAMQTTGLTAEAQMAIDLANSRADETERQLGVFQTRFEAQTFDVEKRQLADLGVPPYITDLARPVLQGSGHTIDLANGQRVDVGQVMRKVLSEYAKMAQMLDLGAELGTPMDEPPGAQPSAEQTARSEVIDRARQQMGL
jgi:hypothetical protein